MGDTSGRCSRSHDSGENGNTSRDEGDRSSRGAHPYGCTSYQYDMSKNKLLHIFNHEHFRTTRDFNFITPPQREGTKNDVLNMTTTFGEFGFHVEAHDDLTHDGILDKLEEICSMDHINTSCLAIAIFTHGEDGGKLYAADKKYQLSEVINYITNEKRLAGKPKLFFIQACRGGKTDKGHRIETDGGHVAYTIPTHADCLVMMSAVDDHVSFRKRSGSWMVQTLCEVLEETREQGLHILEVATMMNNRLAFMTSQADIPMLHEKKQVAETKFTLRKFLKF